MSNITDPFVASVQAAVEALRQSINDPADQIRLLVDLAAYSVSTSDAPSSAALAVCRRAALSSLALATADWQPTSSTDTLAVIALVAPLFEAEIVYAADAGDTATYLQLRALRSAVVADLQARGSQLPAILAVRRNTSLPSLVIAYQLYADATREPDLVSRNSGVVHPAFFPLSFEALSS